MRAVGLSLGFAADLVFGDPRRCHPVAGFGTAAAALERGLYADRRAAGVVHTALLVGGVIAIGAAAESVRSPVLRTALTAAATWTVLGGTSLTRHGAALADELLAGDVAAARARIPALCGRDPDLLDLAGMARAGVESMAENTSDAVVAPLLWGAVAGVPGLLGYRAVNTLDAMVGHRSARYARFGWAAARLDDAANLAPARVAALLFALAAPTVAGPVAPVAGKPLSRQSAAGKWLSCQFWGPTRAALRAWQRDAWRHPSPNAGPVEAAAAGALGVTLGGRTVYRHGAEDRPRLGDGPPPGPDDLRRAAALARTVGAASAVLAAMIASRSPFPPSEGRKA